MENFWTIQVLTPDYLLEGSISTDMLNPQIPFTSPSIFEAYYHHFGYDTTVPLITLTSTSVQPAGTLPVPQNPSPAWVVNADRAIAFIPREGASNTYLLKRNKYFSLVPADLILGSFLVQGSVWSPDKADAGLSFLKKCSRLILQDVIIDQLLPGAAFPRMEVPYAVICTWHLQSAAIRLA